MEEIEVEPPIPQVKGFLIILNGDKKKREDYDKKKKWPLQSLKKDYVEKMKK